MWSGNDDWNLFIFVPPSEWSDHCVNHPRCRLKINFCICRAGVKCGCSAVMDGEIPNSRTKYIFSGSNRAKALSTCFVHNNTIYRSEIYPPTLLQIRSVIFNFTIQLFLVAASQEQRQQSWTNTFNASVSGGYSLWKPIWKTRARLIKGG